MWQSFFIDLPKHWCHLVSHGTFMKQAFYKEMVNSLSNRGLHWFNDANPMEKRANSASYRAMYIIYRAIFYCFIQICVCICTAYIYRCIYVYVLLYVILLWSLLNSSTYIYVKFNQQVHHIKPMWQQWLTSVELASSAHWNVKSFNKTFRDSVTTGSADSLRESNHGRKPSEKNLTLCHGISESKPGIIAVTLL